MTIHRSNQLIGVLLVCIAVLWLKSNALWILDSAKFESALPEHQFVDFTRNWLGYTHDSVWMNDCGAYITLSLEKDKCVLTENAQLVLRMRNGSKLVAVDETVAVSPSWETVIIHGAPKDLNFWVMGDPEKDAPVYIP